MLSVLLNTKRNQIMRLLPSTFVPSIVAWLGLAPFGASGAVLESYSFSGAPLPQIAGDGTAVPVTDSRVITSGIGSLTDVNVSLTLEGVGGAPAFNGDFFVSLTHEESGAFAVLLNRVGRRTPASGIDFSAPFGYAENGVSIILDDQASNGDVHVYRMTLYGSHATPLDVSFEQPLTGIWAPDGRIPSLGGGVVIETPRTALLDSFNGLEGSGTWTLSVADLNGGGAGALKSWGLELTGNPGTGGPVIPEPAPTAVAAGLGALVFAGWRLWNRKSSQRSGR
jgi:hypothetical protein